MRVKVTVETFNDNGNSISVLSNDSKTGGLDETMQLQEKLIAGITGAYFEMGAEKVKAQA